MGGGGKVPAPPQRQDRRAAEITTACDQKLRGMFCAYLLGLYVLISGGRGGAAPANFLLLFRNDTWRNILLTCGMDRTAHEPLRAFPMAQGFVDIEWQIVEGGYQSSLEISTKGSRKAMINPSFLQSLSWACCYRPRSNNYVTLGNDLRHDPSTGVLLHIVCDFSEMKGVLFAIQLSKGHFPAQVISDGSWFALGCVSAVAASSLE